MSFFMITILFFVLLEMNIHQKSTGMLVAVHGFDKWYLSRNMTKPTKWHVCPVKTQISLGIRPVWSESSLSTWRKLGPLATHWAHSKGDAQADLSLCWAHSHFVGFVMGWLISIIAQHSLHVAGSSMDTLKVSCLWHLVWYSIQLDHPETGLTSPSMYIKVPSKGQPTALPCPLSNDYWQVLWHWILFIRLYEPRHKKTCLRGFRPGKTQTGLLSYRDQLESLKFWV